MKTMKKAGGKVYFPAGFFSFSPDAQHPAGGKNAALPVGDAVIEKMQPVSLFGVDGLWRA